MLKNLFKKLKKKENLENEKKEIKKLKFINDTIKM